MGIRANVAIFAGAVILCGVVGCSTPLPTPTHTATECTPARATITWQPKTQVDDAPLGVFVAQYSDGLAQIMTSQLNPKPSYSADTLAMLTDFDDGAIAGWEKALLADVRRTGQVSGTFGEPGTLPEKNPAVPISPHDGTYITEVGVNQFQVPFSISCAGLSPVTGWITAAETGGTSSTLVSCADAPEEPTPATTVALSYCPKD